MRTPRQIELDWAREATEVRAMTRTFAILIESDHPDAADIVREATEKVACQIDWGGNNSARIEAVERREDELDEHLASYDMEPGDD